MTKYIFKRPEGEELDVDEFITESRQDFENFLLHYTTDKLIRDIQLLGIEQQLALDMPTPLTELMNKICDGYYEGMASGDLFKEGLDVLEEDFLEWGRRPLDDFDGITIMEE